MSYLDISLPLSSALPRWPGTPAFSARRRLSLDGGDAVNDTTLRLSAHAGTHVDAPLHFLAEGTAVDELDLAAMIGPAEVVDCGEADAVTGELLDQLGPRPGVERVLFRTRNSARWSSARRFDRSFVALTSEAAERLVELGVRLVGVDGHSVQRFDDGPATHLVLLRAGVVILEGLDLSRASAGRYELLCLPLRLHGVEAAPARALLRRMTE